MNCPDTLLNRRAGLWSLREALEHRIQTRGDNLSESTQRVYRTRIDHGLAEWMDLAVEDITEEMVLEQYERISYKHGLATANIIFRILLTITNHVEALDDRYINTVDVLTEESLWPQKVKQTEGRILPDEELGLLWLSFQTLSYTPRDLLSFVLLTGVSLSDGGSLEWAAVRLGESSVSVGGQPVYLSKQAVSMLAARRVRAVSSYVFEVHIRQSWRPLKRIGPALTVIAEATGIAITALDLQATHRHLIERTASRIDNDHPQTIAQAVTDTILNIADATARTK